MVQVKSRSVGEHVEICMPSPARCQRTQEQGNVGWGKGTHRKAGRSSRSMRDLGGYTKAAGK